MAIETRTIDLDGNRIHPIPHSSTTISTCYPYPSLDRADDRGTQSVSLIRMETEWAIVDVAPGLGGRVWGWFDRLQQCHILPNATELHLVPEGARGLDLHQGLEWLFGPGSLADCVVSHRELDTGEVEVVLMSQCARTGIMIHAAFHMDPHDTALQITLRAANRTAFCQPISWGIRAHVPGLTKTGTAAYAPERGTGLFLEGPCEQLEVDAGGATWWFWKNGSEGEWLLPYEARSWSGRLVPIAGPVTFASDNWIAEVGERLILRATRRQEPAQVLIQTKDGETFSAMHSGDPGVPLNAGLAGALASPVSIRVGDVDLLASMPPPSGALADPVLQTLVDAQQTWGQEPTRASAYFEGLEKGSMADSALNQTALRGPALVRRVAGLIHAQSHDEALVLLDDALGFGAENSLLWWLKAALERNLGAEDSGAILNGPFLAPLDPLFRAEAFLRQGLELGKDPSPLLAPIAQDYHAMVEVAEHYLDFGLIPDAVRWMDECLRHAPVALIHDLLAYAHVQWSGLEFEANQHLEAANRLGLVPPFAHRHVSRRAIRLLHARFPDQPRLQQLVALLDRNPGDLRGC